MNASREDAQTTVCVYARAAHARGLCPGKSGNLSVRYGDGMFITPSAKAYDGLIMADIPFVSSEGVTTGNTKPSSEWRLHHAIYAARPEVNAILHTHSIHAAAWSCIRSPLSAFHYTVAAFGGDTIDCAKYAVWGTAEFAQNAISALRNRSACFLSNHGAVVVADSAARALDLAEELERLAHMRLLIEGLFSREDVVPNASELVERFKLYREGKLE